MMAFDWSIDLYSHLLELTEIILLGFWLFLLVLQVKLRLNLLVVLEVNNLLHFMEQTIKLEKDCFDLLLEEKKFQLSKFQVCQVL